MILRLTFITLLLNVLCSCSSTSTKGVSKKSNLIYQTMTVDCNWPDKIVIDTIFVDNSKFTLKTECLQKISYTDTITMRKDTLLIRNMKDIRYVINSTKFGQLYLTKESLGDSLATDLRKSGFLTPPFQVDFNAEDSSVILKSFIGFAESDFGEVYVLKITTDGKIKVIGTETPNLGEGDGN